jgi:hypothetical protein
MGEWRLVVQDMNVYYCRQSIVRHRGRRGNMSSSWYDTENRFPGRVRVMARHRKKTLSLNISYNSVHLMFFSEDDMLPKLFVLFLATVCSTAASEISSVVA